MTAILANKVVRRRAIAYATLLVVSLALMSVSSNPLIRELQHGVAFAFKPIQVAIDGVASEVSSIATTIAEIDSLRHENASLRAENDLLDAESRSAAELRRENEALTALLQLRQRPEVHDAAASPSSRASPRRPDARSSSTVARTTASPWARS